MCGTRAYRITFKRTNKSRKGKMKVCDEKFAKRWCVEEVCASTPPPPTFTNFALQTHRHVHTASYHRGQFTTVGDNLRIKKSSMCHCPCAKCASNCDHPFR